MTDAERLAALALHLNVERPAAVGDLLIAAFHILSDDLCAENAATTFMRYAEEIAAVAERRPS